MNNKIKVRALEGALCKRAEKEINENPKRMGDDLRSLKDWLQKQPHLHSVKPSDQWLVAFLRGGKYSLEKTKTKLDMYYTLKTIVPEFFADRDPMDPRLQGILKLGVFLPLKNCIKEDSSRICITRVGAFDPTKYHIADLMKVSIMITEILLIEDDNFTVTGEDVVVDSANVGINVLSQWTPALAKKIISTFEKGLPIRVRSTHMLNNPPGFDTAYRIFKMFLGEKFKKRLIAYKQNYKALYKTIPKTVLPVELGGTEGSYQELTDYWKAKVESYRDWFIEQEKARSDESKRSDNPKNSSTVFGVEGSFRKLEFD